MPRWTCLAATLVAATACQAPTTEAPAVDGSADSSSGGGSDESTGEPALSCTPEDGLTLYEQRIAPLLEDDHPSSCNQCHLAGVDLGSFVQASPCETMACMVDQELVDLASPADSVVLSWIERAVPDGGITEQTISAEYDAMLEWIEMSATCGTEVCAPVDDPCGVSEDEADGCDVPPAGVGGPRPVDDPGDCSDRTLELVWKEKVYGWRGRCFPCHSSDHDEDFELAPPWIITGECDLGSLATYRNAQEAGYLDGDEPLQSPLIAKPLDEMLGGIEHGGDAKFHNLEEAALLDFTYFLQRYAECVASD